MSDDFEALERETEELRKAAEAGTQSALTRISKTEAALTETKRQAEELVARLQEESAQNERSREELRKELADGRDEFRRALRLMKETAQEVRKGVDFVRGFMDENSGAATAAPAAPADLPDAIKQAVSLVNIEPRLEALEKAERRRTARYVRISLQTARVLVDRKALDEHHSEAMTEIADYLKGDVDPAVLRDLCIQAAPLVDALVPVDGGWLDVRGQIVEHMQAVIRITVEHIDPRIWGAVFIAAPVDAGQVEIGEHDYQVDTGAEAEPTLHSDVMAAIGATLMMLQRSVFPEIAATAAQALQIGKLLADHNDLDIEEV